VSVTAPAGFRACGVTAGLKDSGRPDLALVVNDGPIRAAAAVLTGNRVQAAPVGWTRKATADGRIDAVVLNSGGANACTGEPGAADTRATADVTAEVLGVDPYDVAVCSTGLIGVRLPMDRLLDGVRSAADRLHPDGGDRAAEAIMTTDSVPKTATVTRSGWNVGGMAKGAGMLAPGLATMLVVLTTDAVAESGTLDTVLRECTRVTFDRVDSDGCMSTNDTVLLLASGSAGVRPPRAELTEAVREVCADLAGQLVADAEGATHDIAVEVVHAATEPDAVEVARAVARSNLVKTAFFGNDPNWGRVVSAVGTTGASFEPDRLDVMINGVQVCRSCAVGDDRDLVDLSARHEHVRIDLHAGTASATVWTNDLTHDYVHENSAYST
jgi:glutamate N-acetyltransferase/amino-acid N-acetyltransferase